MDTQLTPIEAWETFWPWVRLQPAWQKMTRQERQYIYKAVKAHRGNNLGPARIKSLLTKYAPDRYLFQERVILIEK